MRVAVKRQLRRELRETWSAYDSRGRAVGTHPLWNRMSEAEREWARNFELLEIAISMGRVKQDGLPALAALGVNPAGDLVERLNEEAQERRRCNPQRAEKDVARKLSSKKTSRRVETNIYTYDDWVLQKFGFDEKTGETFEVSLTAYSDSLFLDQLSDLRERGQDIDSFMRDPSVLKEMEAAPKRGRPPKPEPPSERLPPKPEELSGSGYLIVRSSKLGALYRLIFDAPNNLEWVLDRGRDFILQDFLARALQDRAVSSVLVRYSDRTETWTLQKNRKRWPHDYPRAIRTSLQIRTTEAKPQGF